MRVSVCVCATTVAGIGDCVGENLAGGRVLLARDVQDLGESPEVGEFGNAPPLPPVTSPLVVSSKLSHLPSWCDRGTCTSG